MPLSDYTQPSSVRAVLGISVKEISDDVVEDVTHLTELLEKLYEISADLNADYLVAKEASPRTPLQTRFVLLVETYSAYLIASCLVPSLRMSAPQTISDGKTTVSRVTDPYKDLKETIDSSMAIFLVRLKAAYALLTPGYTAPVAARRKMVTSTGTAFDNVTGI